MSDAPIRVEVCLGETDATIRSLVSPVPIAAPNTEWRTAAPGSLTEAMMRLAEAALIHDRDFRVCFETMVEYEASQLAEDNLLAALAAVRELTP